MLVGKSLRNINSDRLLYTTTLRRHLCRTGNVACITFWWIFTKKTSDPFLLVEIFLKDLTLVW